MAYAGQLLLFVTSLLLLTFKPVLSSSCPTHPGYYTIPKRGETCDKMKTVAGYVSKFTDATSPFIGLIPVAGDYINTVLSLAKLIPGEDDSVKKLLEKHVDDLDVKLDVIHKDLEWNIWKTFYANEENEIRSAYTHFKDLKTSLMTSSGKEANHLDNFKKHNEGTVKHVKKLYQLLTTTQNSFNGNFEEMLKEHVKCHESNIKYYTSFISVLFYKGNTVSVYFQALNGVIGNSEKLTNYTYEVSSVMFKIWKDCLSKPEKYIEEEVKEVLRGNHPDKTAKARAVRQALENGHNRYDWVTVAFSSKSSSHANLRWRNSHFLSEDYTMVNHGDLTVAIAKQIKGKHRKYAKKFEDAIKKCNLKLCHTFIEELKKCNEKVDKYPLQDTYSAVHVYIHKDKSHDSNNMRDAKEAPDEKYTIYTADTEKTTDTPYIYTGKCQLHKGPVSISGEFKVLIKSDEEIEKADPCEEKECNKGKGWGECALIDNTRIPYCKCSSGRYGVECEESKDDYIKEIKEKVASSPKHRNPIDDACSQHV